MKVVRALEERGSVLAVNGDQAGVATVGERLAGNHQAQFAFRVAEADDPVVAVELGALVDQEVFPFGFHCSHAFPVDGGAQ